MKISKINLGGMVLLCLAMLWGSSALAADSIHLGSAAPDFKLLDVVSGKIISRDEVKGEKGLLIMVICRHCPYVQHVKKVLAQIGKEFQGQGLGVVALSANDAVAYPDDAPDRLREMAVEEGFNFPFLYDENQEIARALNAKATPHLFLFDANLKLVYRGQVDATRPGGEPASGKSIRSAIENLLTGQPISPDQKPAMGCSIKWKKYAP